MDAEVEIKAVGYGKVPEPFTNSPTYEIVIKSGDTVQIFRAKLFTHIYRNDLFISPEALEDIKAWIKDSEQNKELPKQSNLKS